MNALLRQVLFGVGLLGALWLYHHVTQARIDAAEARAAAAAARSDAFAADLAAARTDARIVTRYVDRVQVVRERGRTIVREVPAHVPAAADAACPVPRGFVRVHDAAAAGVDLPAAAGTADAASAGIALSAVAVTVADNYTACHATAEQLTALQAWVRVHAAVADPEAGTARGPPR